MLFAMPGRIRASRHVNVNRPVRTQLPLLVGI